jgi:N-acetylmuramoyl-L-alanine amidase CwlA
VAKYVGPPRAYTSGRQSGQPRVCVIHTTEGGKGYGKAASGVAYDKTRTDGTSCHVFVDPGEALCEVYYHDTAHAARTHGNAIGIQFELCGYASQSGILDEIWMKTLAIAAKEVAAACAEYGIPVRRLSKDQVRQAYYSSGDSRPKGICGHIDITNAFPEDQGTHTDPGSNFPWAMFLDMVNAALTGDTGGVVQSMATVFKYDNKYWVSRGDAKEREVVPGAVGVVSGEMNVLCDVHRVYPDKDSHGYPSSDLKAAPRSWNDALVDMAFGKIKTAVAPGELADHQHDTPAGKTGSVTV